MKTPRTRRPKAHLTRAGYSAAALAYLDLQYPDASVAVQRAVLNAFEAGHDSGYAQGNRDAEAAAVLIDPKTGRPRDLICSVKPKPYELASPFKRRPAYMADTEPPTRKGRWDHKARAR